MSTGTVFAFIILSACLMTPRTCWSQDTRGTIEGRVTDSSGAVVPGVSVTATLKSTNEARTTQTNGSGLFSFPLLPGGKYEISAEKTGFKHVLRSGVELSINDTLEVDLSLEVGAAAETITVAAETPLLETESSSLGQVVNNRTLEELPIPFGTAYCL